MCWLLGFGKATKTANGILIVVVVVANVAAAPEQEKAEGQDDRSRECRLMYDGNYCTSLQMYNA
jgi:hypothetical protein